MTQSQDEKISIKQFFSIFKVYRPPWWVIGVALILVMSETALALAVPLLTMNIVDIMVESSFSVSTAALLGGVFLTQVILSGISLYMMIYIGQIIVARLRNDLWSHVLRLPISFFDKYTSGDTMSRVTHDTTVIKNFFTDQLIPFFSGTVTIIGSLILLFIIDWTITLILLLIVPLSLAVLRPLGKRMYKISKSLQDETASFQGDLGRVLSDIRLVKSSLAEHEEMVQGQSRIDQLFSYGLRAGKILAIVSPLMTTITLLVLVIVFGYGGIQVATGVLSAGSLVAIVFYMFQIITPLSQMAQFFTQFQKAMGASERLTLILEEDIEPVRIADQTFSTETGLTFSEIDFSYLDKVNILKNITFSANKGEMTALVGPSGAGKTTIFSLIERFYQPTAGRISYAHKPIHSYKLRDWREKIAYVSQDSPIMEGSIYNNLTYGLERDVDLEIIKSAVAQSSLTSFIASLPDGYDTEVGERGVRLSGGQRQRLSIARAIIRDPEILLLDEATAHLDSTSERLVQEALNKLMAHRTTLTIAHRLSTVKHAHRLVILQEGRVTGEGTHNELYSTHSFYHQIVHQQMLEHEYESQPAN